MAHIKTISPAGWDWDTPVAAVLKVTGGRFGGHDRGDFVKRAGAAGPALFEAEMARVKFAKDEVPVHLIALGAKEAWGCNRNGDAFTEATLKAAHDTFVKHAFFFRNHCFPAGTLITMADRRRIAIERVRVGDSVATKVGPKKVTRVQCDPYNGSAMQLIISGVATPTVVTPEHPILIVRRDALHCRHNYCCLTIGRHQKCCLPCQRLRRDLKSEYVNAGDVRAGDYVLIPCLVPGKVAVSPRFAALVGWVASEGYLSKNGRHIQFTFSVDNETDIAAVTACLLANGVRTITRTDREDDLVQLTCSSASLHKKLSLYITGVKAKKRLRGKVLTWNRRSLLKLLTAYIDGDGCVGAKYNRGQLRIRSSSPAMLAVLGDILHAVGVPTTTNIDRDPGVMVSPSNGKLYPANGSGCIAVNAYHSPLVTSTSRKYVARHGRRAQQLEFDGCYLRKVTAVTEIELNEPVYNFEVEDVHHYLVNNFIVHNCNKPHEGHPKYGVVKASVYNPVMRRVELLCGLPATKQAAEILGTEVADKECEKLARGDDIAVSMACRVPYDECSCCHNQARTREEYCKAATCAYGGCYDNLTRLIKVGNDVHHLHVENPYPVFFDISNVYRPADRTAYGGRADWVKAAADGFFGVGGAATASALGLEAPLSVVLAQDVAAARTPRLADQVKLAHGLAALDQRTASRGPAAVRAAFAPGVQPTGPWAALGLAGSATEKAAALGAMADRKIVLSLHAFADMTKRAGAVPAAAGRLGGVYLRMISDGSLEPRLAANAFSPSEKVASAAQRAAADALVPAHSLEKTAVAARGQRAAIRGLSAPDSNSVIWIEKAAEAGAAEDLARDYACYQVAALHRIAQFDDDFLLTARLATCQNHC